MFQHQFPHGAQPDLFPLHLDQGFSHGFGQAFDLHADGGLGFVDPFAGQRETPRFSHHRKGVEKVDGDMHEDAYMKKMEDKNTRYFIDLDLQEQRILHWGYDQRERLAAEKLEKPHYHRVFITRGQYNKLDRKRKTLPG